VYVDYTSGHLFCKHIAVNRHQHFRQHRVKSVSLLGQNLILNRKMYGICAQPGCGVVSVLCPDKALINQYGIACMPCTFKHQRQTSGNGHTPDHLYGDGNEIDDRQKKKPKIEGGADDVDSVQSEREDMDDQLTETDASEESEDDEDNARVKRRRKAAKHNDESDDEDDNESVASIDANDSATDKDEEEEEEEEEDPLLAWDGGTEIDPLALLRRRR
jgi:hypothetical protein